MTQFLAIFAMAANLMSAWQPFQAQFMRSTVGKTITICLDGRKVERTFAGKMVFRDNSGTWASVCADVRSPIAQGNIMTIHPMRSSKYGGNVTRAGNIVAKYFRAAQTPEQCAGLQIAVWKMLEDGGTEPDFRSGSFQVIADASVLAYAATYFQAADTPGESYVLAAAGAGQSQLTPM